jgi:death on curing protein
LDAEPRWITFEEVVETNAEQIKLFGGLYGIRDEGAIKSAVANPQNLYHYEGQEDLLVLAVRTCMALARNHGFVDGNKRTAAVSMIAFLAVNGYDFVMNDDTSLGRLIEAVIEGDMTEDDLVEHLDPFVVDRT